MPHCFLILCGLPASGKSTLAQKLKISSELLSQFQVVLLSYDDLMPENLKAFLTDNKNLSQEGCPTWKKYREDIIDCVDHLLNSLSLEERKEKPEKVSEELWVNFKAAFKPVQKSKSFLFVVDDNMYYRGMRYDFYQMARKYGCGFCQIYLKINLECALMRNQKRPSPVPGQVIKTMASRFEPPSTVTKQWENHSLIFEASTNQDLKPIFDLVQTAQENPAPPLKDDTDLRELQDRNRRQCSESSLHQIDQILRRLVSEKMASIGVNAGSEEKKRVAKHVREARMNILSCLKSGELEIPLEIKNVQDASKDINSRLFLWLDEIFKSFCD